MSTPLRRGDAQAKQVLRQAEKAADLVDKKAKEGEAGVGKEVPSYLRKAATDLRAAAQREMKKGVFHLAQIETIHNRALTILKGLQMLQAPSVPTHEPQGATFRASTRTPPAAHAASRRASIAARGPMQEANRQAAQQSKAAMARRERLFAEGRRRLGSSKTPDVKKAWEESERLAKYAKKRERADAKEMAKVKRWGRKAIDEDKSADEEVEGKGKVKRAAKKVVRKGIRGVKDVGERVSPPKRRLGY